MSEIASLLPFVFCYELMTPAQEQLGGEANDASSWGSPLREFCSRQHWLIQHGNPTYLSLGGPTCHLHFASHQRRDFKKMWLTGALGSQNQQGVVKSSSPLTRWLSKAFLKISARRIFDRCLSMWYFQRRGRVFFFWHVTGQCGHPVKYHLSRLPGWSLLSLMGTR